MILFIHGFSSHGYGGKARALRAYFADKEETFIAPSLSYVPDLAIQTLEELIEMCDDVKLIGSSLGGFYTIYLAEKYGLRAVLINPSIYPWKTLTRTLGMAPNFYDGSLFEWQESHLEMLKKYETDILKPMNYLLMVQKGDDVLNYCEAVEKLSNATMMIEDGGDHSFIGIEQHFDTIKLFLEKS